MLVSKTRYYVVSILLPVGLYVEYGGFDVMSLSVQLFSKKMIFFGGDHIQ